MIIFENPSTCSYDLDPDDGYAGRVLLPYESYYTKDYKSLAHAPHVQTTVQPSYFQKPVTKPLSNDYDFKAEPISGFEPYDPYKLSVTTLDTHQHLTETAPIQQHQQQQQQQQSDQNQSTTITIKPVTTYHNNFIPTSSSKPIQEVLNNINRTSLQLLLTKLKDSNYLPKTFTMNKLDNSIKTLAKVLVDLKKAPKPIKNYEYAQRLPDVDHLPKIPPIKTSYEHVKPIHPLKSNAGKQQKIVYV